MIPTSAFYALDRASGPFRRMNALRNKPVAVIGPAKGSPAPSGGLADRRKILRTIGALVDDRELAVGQAHETFTDDGGLRHPLLAARLRAIVNDLLCERVERAA